MEYTVRDHASALGIDSECYGQPTLKHLADEVEKILPNLESKMRVIRSNGNSAVHPGRSKVETTFEKKADQSLENLLDCMEAIYGIKKKK